MNNNLFGDALQLKRMGYLYQGDNRPVKIMRLEKEAKKYDDNRYNKHVLTPAEKAIQ